MNNKSTSQEYSEFDQEILTPAELALTGATFPHKPKLMDNPMKPVALLSGESISPEDIERVGKKRIDQGYISVKNIGEQILKIILGLKEGKPLIRLSEIDLLSGQAIRDPEVVVQLSDGTMVESDEYSERIRSFIRETFPVLSAKSTEIRG